MSTIDDILKRARPLDKGQSLAPNQVLFRIGESEFVVDLLYVEPNSANPDEPDTVYVQKVVIPVEMGKTFVEGLSQVVEDWEKSHPEMGDIKDKDISAMSKEELVAAVESLFGSWANRDDIPDDWVTKLRHEADSSLRDLYGSDSD